jgi:hypothetical protein
MGLPDPPHRHPASVLHCPRRFRRPALGKAADGRTVLVGVNSYTAKVGTGVRSRAGEESGHTRVALYLEWIDGIAGKLDAECIMPGCQP